MLKIRKIKPIGSQILVTQNLYGWDDFDESGLIIHKRGDLKVYQQVIAVGDDVRFVKPGDTVSINFYKYAVFKEDPNSVKAMADNPIVGFRLNTIDMEGVDGEPVQCLLVDQRDVNYIMEDWDEVTYEQSKHKLITVEQPKMQLILPNKDIKA